MWRKPGKRKEGRKSEGREKTVEGGQEENERRGKSRINTQRRGKKERRGNWVNRKEVQTWEEQREGREWRGREVRERPVELGWGGSVPQPPGSGSRSHPLLQLLG